MAFQAIRQYSNLQSLGGMPSLLSVQAAVHAAVVATAAKMIKKSQAGETDPLILAVTQSLRLTAWDKSGLSS